MLLIRGGELIDGTGREPREADVLIRGNRISAIGHFPRQSADTVIDATGYTLVPGFIDVNTDSDHYLTLFSNPGQESFLTQGVTTTIGGHCGSSLAPLLYGSLESISKWTDVNRVNVAWGRMKEFLRVLETHGLGVNFGTLVGHATIRRALIGESARDLTDREQEIFKRILGEALEEGALGLSTGLGYVHAAQTPFHEIRACLAVVAKYRGVYTTHLRNESDGLQGAIHEAIRLIQETKVRGVISHLRPLLGYEREFGKAVHAVEEAGKSSDVYFDGYPFSYSFVSLYTLLPHWMRTGGVEEMNKNLRRPGISEQILRELPKFGPDDIVVVESSRMPEVNGKTIGAFARSHNLLLRESLLELMRSTRLRATVLFRNVNEDLALQSLLSPNALVASNAPGVHDAEWFRHERFHKTFSKFLSFVHGSRTIPFEKAIQKLTSIPAKIFGIRDRGEIADGKFADIVLLKNGIITDVFVNGVPSVRFGKLLQARGGVVIRRV